MRRRRCLRRGVGGDCGTVFLDTHIGACCCFGRFILTPATRRDGRDFLDKTVGQLDGAEPPLASAVIAVFIVVCILLIRRGRNPSRASAEA